MARVKPNGHGGDVYAAARELGCGIDRLIDFSASINPLGPSPKVWRALSQSRIALQHYPDPACWELRKALAAQWRCASEQIVVGNGSTELIHALPSALGLRHLLVVGPTFSEYAAAMSRAGGRSTMLCAEREQDYRSPLECVASLLRRTHKAHHDIDAVLLCNPNSPTGQACDADAVLELARLTQRRRKWLIVDESFADYCPERSILPQSVSLSTSLVLRSLTKFHGLSGLRVGYAVAAAETAGLVRAQLPPWSVNALGQIAALAALNDRRHIERSLAFMRKERARFVYGLATLPGCRVFRPHANFVLMELPRRWRADEAVTRLRQEGLLVRDCSSVPGITRHAIRMAVRTRLENARLLKALARILASR